MISYFDCNYKVMRRRIRAMKSRILPQGMLDTWKIAVEDDGWMFHSQDLEDWEAIQCMQAKFENMMRWRKIFRLSL